MVTIALRSMCARAGGELGEGGWLGSGRAMRGRLDRESLATRLGCRVRAWVGVIETGRWSASAPAL